MEPTLELQIKVQELKLEELIQVGWRVFKNNFPVLLPAILLYAAIVISYYFVHYFLLQLDGSHIMSRTLLNILTWIAFTIFVNLIVLSLIVNGAIKAEKVSFEKSIKSAYEVWPSSIWTNFLTLIILAGLFLLFIIPSIIWSVCYVFVTYVVALKGKKDMDALRYSESLTEWRWWKVFSVIFVLSVFGMAPSAFFQIIYIFIHRSILTDIIVRCLEVLIFCYSITAQVVLFRNLEYLKNVPEPVEKPVNPLDLVPTFGKDKKVIEQQS
ncbi:MAG: hypothetical protein ABSG42_00985 [Nitrospirota bacterium]